MYLSVIIPAYNEEKRIMPTLDSVDSYLKNQHYDYEIVVVSDGSKDRTVSLVEGARERIRGLRVIDTATNHGKGYAVRKGMLETTGKLRLFMDADNATTIDNFEKMMPYIDEGYGVVIASIGIKGAKSIGHEPFYRRLFGKGGNLIIQIMAVPGVKDTQRGFKLFTAKSAEDIFKRVINQSWGFDIEFFAIARKLKYKIKEVPIIWKNDPNSKVSIWAFPKVLLETFKIRWNLMTGKYE
jgi:dolichyl-phosphate beta-glucosyltransferase